MTPALPPAAPRGHPRLRLPAPPHPPLGWEWWTATVPLADGALARTRFALPPGSTATAAAQCAGDNWRYARAGRHGGWLAPGLAVYRDGPVDPDPATP